MKSRHFSLICVPILLFLSLITASCKTTPPPPETPATVFATTIEPYNDGLYEIALQRLNQFKSRYPYSKQSALADLYIANSHFNLGNYQEASIAYSQYIKLHPNHKDVDFAHFRIGESFWVEAPEEIDREQEFTVKALEEWQVLLRRFPKSSYNQKARERIRIGKKRIAESNVFIMNFYCKQKKYHACAFKAVAILEEFKDFPNIRQNAVKKAALSFEKMAEIKKKNPDDDSNIYFRSLSSKQLTERAASFQKLIQKN